MFRRFFANTPQKLMSGYLGEVCPDQNLWGEIQAYLVKGRRAKTPAAKAALGAYLDLREALSGLAAFRAGGELTYASLASPCRDFACAYDAPAGLDSEAAMAWARFILAADHLLALAYEASLTPGVSRDEQARRMKALFRKAQHEYLTPLGQEKARGMQGLEEPVNAPGAAEAAAA